MQVQRIQSNQQTFGYNVPVNEQLINKLSSAKKNKAYYGYLKDLCLATNRAEDELREAERKEKKILFPALMAVFVPMKLLLTDMINVLFPELDYRNKEIESYSNELKLGNWQGNPQYWMNRIINTLKESAAEDKANAMSEFLSVALQEIFNEPKVVLTGLNEPLKNKYLSENEEIPQEGIFENADEASAGADEFVENKDKAKRIEAGKNLVRIYEPKTDFQKRGLDALAGMEDLKEELRRDIIQPLKNIPQAKYNEQHYAIDIIPKAVLFYGPPGCGKTTFVKAISVEAGLPLLLLSRDSFGSIYKDGNVQNLGAIFDYAESIATEEKPVILFIDDIDTVAPSRDDRLETYDKAELGVWLERIDNAPANNIIVFAATNEYKNIDKAFISRLRNQKEIKLPDDILRRAILEMKLKESDHGLKLSNDKEAIDKIVKLTKNFNIRAIEDFVTDVRKIAFYDKNGTRDMTLEDFESVIKKNENKRIDPEKYIVKPEKDSNRKSVGFNTNA